MILLALPQIQSTKAVFSLKYFKEYHQSCPLFFESKVVKLPLSSKHFDEFSSTLTRYAKDNIAFVKLYMREPFAEVLQVSVKTTALDYISNIGGLMGLCMGFSLVTVAEILYHGLDAIWVKFFSSSKKARTFVRRDNRRIAAQP